MKVGVSESIKEVEWGECLKGEYVGEFTWIRRLLVDFGGPRRCILGPYTWANSEGNSDLIYEGL